CKHLGTPALRLRLSGEDAVKSGFWLVAAVALAAGAAPMQQAVAQATPPVMPTAATASLKAEEIDQLVAPIALYPDQLLVQVLTAATYPLEVVMAARWVADPKNAKLKGDALNQALLAQSWDPSVKSLVPFPPLLKM